MEPESESLPAAGPRSLCGDELRAALAMLRRAQGSSPDAALGYERDELLWDADWRAAPVAVGRDAPEGFVPAEAPWSDPTPSLRGAALEKVLGALRG